MYGFLLAKLTLDSLHYPLSGRDYQHQDKFQDLVNCGIFICYYFDLFLVEWAAFERREFNFIPRFITSRSMDKVRSTVLYFLHEHLDKEI